MLKLSLEKFNSFMAEIAKAQQLYMPVDTADGSAKFEQWAEGKELSKKLNTARSAKDFFFPQTESLVDFKVSGKTIEIIDTRSEAEDFVLFGVRACDAKSFLILDRVFLSEPVDTYYKSRREHCTVITLACTRPTETCFCQTFGIDPTEPAGDISAWKTENAFFFEPQTEKGKKLISSLEKLLEKADGKEVEAQKAKTKEILQKLPLKNVSTQSFGGDALEKMFSSDKWNELSSTCIACGTCTFVCPTCQCYDIKDFDTGHGIQRFRCWDSCMYSDFTKMSAGQPRLSQLERFRQRFMHKLVYFPANNEGEFGCVGCGRCLAKCPISMNIVKVMKTLGGKENE